MRRCAWFLTIGSLATNAAATEPPTIASEWELGAPESVELAAYGGLQARVDDPPAFALDAAQSGLVGAGVGVPFSRRVGLGLRYEHSGLGRESSGVTSFGEQEVSRELDALWLGLRLHPVRGHVFGAYLGIGVALAFQSLDAAGVSWPDRQPALGVPYECSAGGPVGMGLRAELGLDAQLGGGLRAELGGGLDGYRLTSDPLDGCALGAGSAQALGLRAGLAYAFDLGSDE